MVFIYNLTTIKFNPVDFAEVGTHLVNVSIADDGGLSLVRSFYVYVRNEAPYFTNNTLVNL